MPPATKVTVDFAHVQQMLVDGGYFRAKLSTFLTEFDIVAGGLSWCIRSSRYAIDVDFVEDAAIRHKIKVAENICKALKLMKCPESLHPHQIQGLDYPVLAGIFKWLLKRVAAAREEHAYSVRQLTKTQFETRFGAPLFDGVHPVGEAVAARDQDPNSANTHTEPGAHHQLSRLFFNLTARQGGNAAPTRVMVPPSHRESFRNRMEHVSSVLLEYGDRYVVTDAAAGEDDDEDAQEKRDRQSQAEAEERERALMERLASTMTAHHGKEKLSSAGIGSVLRSTDQNKLSRLQAQYQARREELEAQLAAEEAERNRLEKRQAKLADLEGEMETLKTKLKKAKSQAAKAEAAAAEVVEAVEAEEQTVVDLEQAVADAEAQARADADRASILDDVLVKQAEVKELEAEVAALAEQRATELGDLKTEVAAMQDSLGDVEGAEAVNAAELERLTTLRAQLQEEVQTVETSNLQLQRQIDQYPTRLELQQYQTRVTELDEEIAWKYEETKLAFFRYNTFVEVMRCVDNELDVFTTIEDSYGSCRTDEKPGKNGPSKEAVQARSDFLEEVDHFAKQIGAARDQQAQKLGDEEKTLAHRAQECADLVARQQEVNQQMAKMKSAAEKHARLSAQLRELEEAAAETRDNAEVDGSA